MAVAKLVAEEIRFPSPLSGSRFSKQKLDHESDHESDHKVSIPFKRVSVFKVLSLMRQKRGWQGKFPSPLSGSRFSKWSFTGRRESAKQVSIPFKRVSVFKDGTMGCGLCGSSREFPSPLSGSRFSKSASRSLSRARSVCFHPL